MSLNIHFGKFMKTLVMYGQVLRNPYSITSLTLYSHHAKIEVFLLCIVVLNRQVYSHDIN